MSENKSIQLGLCCMNTILSSKKPPIMSSRSVVLKTLETKGFEPLKEKIIQNLKDTLVMMDWNEQNGIKVFRLSSELFPHYSNSKASKYEIDFALDLLKQIGEKSKKYNQRITFHPGQYNVIGTPSKSAFEHTINDLKYHCDILDLMGLDKNSVVVIHGGGVYGDKKKTIERWCKQFYDLPENVQKRLVLENCEKNFSIEDCLEVSEKVNIPVVFDTHHFECYKLLHKEEKFNPPDEYMHAVLETWWRRDIKPKFHVSEQGSGKIGHHSDFIEEIPDYLLEIPEKFGCNIDIMIEAKLKEQAIFKLYEKYIFLNCKIAKKKIKLNVKAMEWAQRCNYDCQCCE
uniref:UV damage repair endonuclease n=1 Tax=viral metagenome TaxID=1070528 RepID=A0A6C0AZL6_9ZZZZ|tara:strand:+ start:24342 stop:25370 length:1029 start_codon:yes stop_codon:yes gene_type:complete